MKYYAGIGSKETPKQDELLKEGDLIRIVEGHKVRAQVPEKLVYNNRKDSDSLTWHGVVVGEQFKDIAGEYIVDKTALEGGGTGHGRHDVYPDGHHVYCFKVDDPSERIDFYQSGCFNTLVKDIKPIGKAKKSWTIEERY